MNSIERPSRENQEIVQDYYMKYSRKGFNFEYFIETMKELDFRNKKLMQKVIENLEKSRQSRKAQINRIGFANGMSREYTENILQKRMLEMISGTKLFIATKAGVLEEVLKNGYKNAYQTKSKSYKYMNFRDEVEEKLFNGVHPIYGFLTPNQTGAKPGSAVFRYGECSIQVTEAVKINSSTFIVGDSFKSYQRKAVVSLTSMPCYLSHPIPEVLIKNPLDDTILGYVEGQIFIPGGFNADHIEAIYIHSVGDRQDNKTITICDRYRESNPDTEIEFYFVKNEKIKKI